MENKIDHITYTVTKKFQFKFYWNETTSIIFFLKLIRLTRINRMQMLGSYHWQQNLSNDFIIWEWYLNPCYNSESLLCTSLRFCIFFRFFLVSCLMVSHVVVPEDTFEDLVSKVNKLTATVDRLETRLYTMAAKDSNAKCTNADKGIR